MTVHPFLPSGFSVHSTASHCSQTSSMLTSLSPSGLPGWNLQDSPQRRDYPLVKPWRRASLKGATAFSICSWELWYNHEPALLPILILVQVCSHQMQTWGCKCLRQSLQELPAPLVSLGWLCCSMGLTQALQEDAEIHTQNDATEEWKYKQFTTIHQNSPQTSTPHLHGAVRPQNSCDSLPLRTKLRQGKIYRPAERSHTHQAHQSSADKVYQVSMS